MAITKLNLTGGDTPFDPADPGTFPAGFSPFEDSVQTELDGKVSTSGAETVAGVKTFTSSPIVPEPSAASEAATKNYVDAVATQPTAMLQYRKYDSVSGWPVRGTVPTGTVVMWIKTNPADPDPTIDATYALANVDIALLAQA